MNRRRRSIKKRPPMALWGIVLVLFMVELLIYSWCRVQVVQTGYDIDEAMQEKQRLLALNKELKVEEARLRSPERIRRLARQRGLVMPDTRQIVVLP